jgi:hypothetical protein
VLESVTERVYDGVSVSVTVLDTETLSVSVWKSVGDLLEVCVTVTDNESETVPVGVPVSVTSSDSVYEVVCVSVFVLWLVMVGVSVLPPTPSTTEFSKRARRTSAVSRPLTVRENKRIARVLADEYRKRFTQRFRFTSSCSQLWPRENLQ